MPTVPGVALRHAVAADAAALAELHAWSWRVTYGPLLPEADRARLTVEERRRLWDRVLLQPEPRESVTVAEVAGRIVGLVLATPSPDDDAGPTTGEIGAIHVEPGLHGRGIGAMLLTAAEADLRAAAFTDATLWVIRENAEARRFYAGRGWLPDGAEKRGPMGGFDGLPIVDEVRYRRALGRG